MIRGSKRFIPLALLLVLVVLPVGAQNKPRTDPLDVMVNTERAFSRMSEEKGIRESFTEFIAEDGILFRPRAVLGKKWMRENPLPPSTTRPLLVWQPILAGISRAGDLGYTTGPWQFKNDIKDSKFSGFGNFMTVWRKQPDGKWKFAVDLGISNPDPKSQPQLVSVRPSAGRFNRIDATTERENLLNTERAFSQASIDRGAVEAFLKYAAPEVRVLRNQHQPFIGRKSALEAMPPLATEFTWTPEAGDVSSSGDLGYTYGLYYLRNKATNTVSEAGNYMRVWRKVNGAWKLILDVTDPHPRERNS